jgi:hypothetical protein
MGLDMYLSKRHYVRNWNHMAAAERHEITVKKGDGEATGIKPERITYIIEQVAYWRKANQIHAWFVENVQDGKDECQETYCDREKLQELLDTVNKVLADHSLAAELLPTESGFFFGSSEYDKGYWNDLTETKTVLTEVLAEPDTKLAWSLDDGVLRNIVATDGVDCDGRMSTYDEYVCPVEDRHSRPNMEGWLMPAWESADSSQRDYSAEAAGY